MEKPRERLSRCGETSLSEAELIALLIRQGCAGKNGIALSQEILERFSGLRGVFSAGYEELLQVRGLGPAKTSALLAARELAKRYLREGIQDAKYVKDPRMLLDYLWFSLRDQPREIFKVIFLNKANRIIADEDMFSGTVDETAVHPREILRRALHYHATALILVHNHPSGKIQPSRDDHLITRKLKDICENVNIKILDHIIVGDNQYFSFSEQGVL